MILLSQIMVALRKLIKASPLPDGHRGPSSAYSSTLEYPCVWVKGVLNGYSSTRVSLWGSLMFGRVLEY